MLTGIVAISKDGVIGHQGKIPWKVPEDLRHFKEVTYGAAVVMGRLTFQSLKKPLEKRLNVVMSKDAHVQGICMCTADKQDVIEISKQMKTFIIGGTSIYTLFAKDISEWIVTRIPIECGLSDTYFPEFILQRFRLESTIPLEGTEATIETWKRSKPDPKNDTTV